MKRVVDTLAPKETSTAKSEEQIISEVRQTLVCAAQTTLVYSLAFEGAGSDMALLADVGLMAACELRKIHTQLLDEEENLANLITATPETG